MSIQEIIESGSNVQLIVTASDLADFAEDVARKAISQHEQHLQAVKAFEERRHPDSLTTQEVCKALGCCDETIRRWGKSGYLPFVKVGGKKRFKIEDINRILNDDCRTGI